MDEELLEKRLDNFKRETATIVRHKRNRKPISGRLPPFVPMTWDMLNNKAYKELPPSSAKALPYFLGKIKGGYRDGQRCSSVFEFSYREANKLGFATSTFSKIIRNLIKHGFIDPVSKGGLRGEGRSCSAFNLSERWRLYGAPNFVQIEWRCFL